MDKTTCYCCDEPAIGQGDHVPPRALFPTGSFSNAKPIIVPSCAEHNQQKSQSDEYLKFILNASSEFAPSDVQGSTVRGLIRHATRRSKCLQDFGFEQRGQELITDGSAPVDFGLLNAALEKIARGIYFHHSNGEKKLLGRLLVCPIFLGIDPLTGPTERERLMQIGCDTIQDMKKMEMLGEFKELFCYQVIEDAGMIVINMKFYVDRIVSVMHSKT